MKQAFLFLVGFGAIFSSFADDTVEVKTVDARIVLVEKSEVKRAFLASVEHAATHIVAGKKYSVGNGRFALEEVTFRYGDELLPILAGSWETSAYICRTLGLYIVFYEDTKISRGRRAVWLDWRSGQFGGVVEVGSAGGIVAGRITCSTIEPR